MTENHIPNVVYFIEDGHKYFIYDEEGNKIPYTSVSGYVKPYIPQFKRKKISEETALRQLLPDRYEKLKRKYQWWQPEVYEELRKHVDKKELDAKIKEILGKWDNKGDVSRDVGTMIHDEKEQAEVETGFAVNEFNGKKYPLMNGDKSKRDIAPADLSQLEDGYYNELIVYNHDRKIAGRIDRLFIETIGGYRYIDIGDWKTDEEIRMLPKFFDHVNSRYETLHPPLNHLLNTNFYVYSIKLSLYAWMLEQYGFTARHIGITHVLYDRKTTEIEEEEVIEFVYRSFELEMILD